MATRPSLALEAPAVPGYEIEGMLGEGGFARVWMARQRAGETLAAIKVAHAATGLAQMRFAEEAHALRRAGSPHVPALYDHGILDDGRPYLVMEFLGGKTLSAHLEELVTPPTTAWISDIGNAVLASLEALHAQGLVHRDLNPDNIVLMSAPLRACLVDLGIAGRGSPEGGETAVLGTAEYMAPEQITGHGSVDARADVYAFGVILYELLTLRVPFTGDRVSIEKGHCTLRPPRPSEFATVPESIEQLALECMAKDATRRPPDATSLRRRLTEVCRSAGEAPIRLKTTAAPGVKLLSVARQPVVLLVAEVTAVEPAMLEVMAQRKGVVVGQTGRRMICGFGGISGDRPEQAALLAARELVAVHGARVALHVAELKVRPGTGERAPRMYGLAVQEPERWLPRSTWTGMLCTAAMANILPEGQTRPAPEHPGFHALVAVEEEVAEGEPVFVGCAAVLDEARKSLAACVDEATPGMLTLVGDHGLGKSRLARVIADMVKREHPAITVHVLEAGLRPVTDGSGAQPGRSPELWKDFWQRVHREANGRDPVEPLAASDGAVRIAGDALRHAATRGPLAIIIDDVHAAGDDTLDALEYATLDGAGIALWVVVTAHPRLERRRPQWGRRAHRHCLVHLGPLDEPAAIRLAADLLRPAEYPPRAALERLVQWTAGNPHDLIELVRTLKRQGLVQRRGETWYVATAELDRLPASPVGQWLAARQLDDLPAEIAACVRVCAVLGQEIDREELAWVENAADQAGTASTSVDPDVGLSTLEAHGIISRVQGNVWVFCKASFQDAIYKLMDAPDRESIHRSALAYWQSRSDGSERHFASVARHAGACGESALAAEAFLELGDRARTSHRHVEADLHYTAAMQYIAGDDGERLMRALGGRGRVRYRTQRIVESLDDLRHAQEHARRQGDDVRLADLLLEEATALDWATAYAESAQRVEEARHVVEACADPHVEARYLLALGRSHYRAGRGAECIDVLGRAHRAAHALDDGETCIIALLLRSAMLAFAARLDESEASFAEVLDLCERLGDRFHLCVAYNNRAVMWAAKGAQLKLYADLRRAIQLAREVGQPLLERSAAHNLAEFLHWSGRHRDALELARRAYALRRFSPEEIAADALLLARILAACDEDEEARAMVDEARTLAQSGDPTVSDDLAIAMLDMTLASGAGAVSGAAWDELLQDLRESSAVGFLLEVLYFRARAALRADDRAALAAVIAEARDRLPDCPAWETPFRLLAERL